MLVFARLGCAGLLAAVTLAVTPAFAASMATDAYLANIRLDIDFLRVSSRLAQANAQSDSVRHFADDQSRHLADALAALDGRRASKIAAVAAPLQTGRSVASDATVNMTIDTARYSAPEGTGSLMPAAAMTLDHLAAMKGAAFDSAFTSVQTNVLKELAGFYEAYSLKGDDSVLRDMADRELADVRAELEAIEGI